MRRLPLFLLLGSVLVVTALRIALVRAGPDLDSDSYGHAIIGRTLLSNWSDVRQHWVWLPLWHFVFTGLTFLSAGVTEVRYLNVAVCAALPCVLTALLRVRDPRGFAPYLGGIFASVFPLWIEHGTSAEPEPWFALLFLGAALCIEKRRPALGGVVFAFAVLLRYEGWAVLPAFALLALLRGRGVRAPLAFLAAPVAAIAFWCIVHQRATGEWLQFVRLNREFVVEARSHNDGSGPEQTVYWYAATLPYREIGWTVLLAPVGLWGLVRRRHLGVLVPGAWLLAFVTYGWVRGQHLGLDRHFFTIVPLYAAALGYGPETVVRLARGWAPLRPLVRPGLGSVAVGAWALFAVVRSYSWPAYDRGLVWHREAFVPEREAAAALAAAPPGAVFCDLPRVEIFSRLPPARFVRWNVADVGLENARGEARSEGKGRAYVVSRNDKFSKLKDEMARDAAPGGGQRWLLRAAEVSVLEVDAALP